MRNPLYADPDHLAVLNQGQAIWNQWRHEYPDIRPYLRKANLKGANLKGFDLHEVDFFMANLSEATLDEVNLQKSLLNGTLIRATLISGESQRSGCERGRHDSSDSPRSDTEKGGCTRGDILGMPTYEVPICVKPC